MNSNIIFFPVMALVALTFVIGFSMLRSRFSAVKNKQISIKYFQLNRGEQPDQLQRLSDNYDNLLSMPMLFYMAMILVVVINAFDPFYLALAWLYVATRFVHSYIHIIYNNVIHRMYAFVSGILVLVLIWLRLFFYLLTEVVQ